MATRSRATTLSFQASTRYKNPDFQSPEHAFHRTRAYKNNQPKLASKILKAKTSYEAMRIGKRIKTSDEYKLSEPKMLHDIYLAKYEQRPELSTKLIKLKGNLYQATKHTTYGAGFSLTQKDQICKANVRGGNKLGHSLENIRQRLIDANTVKT